MNITKRQLRRIIREQGIGHETHGTGIDRGNRFTPDVIVQYLSDNAATYHQDPVLDAGSIAMLLRDDFMDNIGAQVALSPEYEEIIVKLAQDPGYVAEGKRMKITKRQLKRIIKEEKVKLLSEMIDPEYMREEILSFAETTDPDGMAVLINILEEPPIADLDAAFDIVDKHVATASPEDLNWIHQEMTSEGLFG